MADPSFMQYLQGSQQGFNPYGAGNKVYGSGRSMPNLGPVTDREGYAERDRAAKARKQQMKRNSMLRYMQASQRKQYMSQPWLRKGR